MDIKEHEKQIEGLIGVINLYQKKLSEVMNFLHERNMGVYYISFTKQDGTPVNHGEFFLTQKEAEKKAMSMFNVEGSIISTGDSFEIKSLY